MWMFIFLPGNPDSGPLSLPGVPAEKSLPPETPESVLESLPCSPGILPPPAIKSLPFCFVPGPAGPTPGPAIPLLPSGIPTPSRPGIRLPSSGVWDPSRPGIPLPTPGVWDPSRPGIPLLPSLVSVPSRPVPLVSPPGRPVSLPVSKRLSDVPPASG